MIDIIREGSKTKENSKREIPQNVRQVGEVKGKERIYIEDYIVTFIKQIANSDDSPKVLILYGNKQKEDGIDYMFVNGALLAETIESNKKSNIIIDEKIWQDVNEKASRFFPNSSVLGWVYVRYDLADFIDVPVLKTHKQYFNDRQQIFIEYSVSERIEKLYCFEKGSMALQSGYYVYYEQNEAMQNYMITIKQDEPEEMQEEVDRAAKRFRGIVAEKKEEIHRKQTMGMLYGTSVAMMLIVTIVGVTMLNNYEKMQSMEKVLFDISEKMTDEELQDIGTAGIDIDAQEKEVTAMNEVSDDTANLSAGNIAGIAEGMAKAGQETDAVDIENLKDDTVAAMSSDVTQNISENQLPDEPVEEVPAEEPEIEETSEVITPTNYVIEKGDTLELISKKFYGDGSMIKQICELNKIENQDSIRFGDNIILP